MFTFEDTGAKYKRDYTKICKDLNRYEVKGDSDKAIGLMRVLAKDDLFFLMYFILGVHQCNHPWLVDRLLEVEAQYDQTLNLWPRGHWKSSVFSYALVIQIILNNPEIRVAIFSETRQIAKSFLRRIKNTFEKNTLLRAVFPDIIYSNPERQSTKWSEDEGLVLNRKGAFIEPTIGAWGMDHLPTGHHYDVLVFDDLVNERTVNTAEQIQKLENSFSLCFGLTDTAQGYKAVVLGTIYHYMDLNQKLSESGEWFTRRYPAEDADGNGVYLSNEELQKRKMMMGSYTYASQMLLDPIASDRQVFMKEWLKYFRVLPPKLNMAIFVDPADADRKASDSTVMALVGVDSFKNYYLVDMVRDKLNLKQRAEVLEEFVIKWNCRTVHYEHTGQGRIDIQYIKERMMDTGTYFDIKGIKNYRIKKEQRIASALQPLFESGKFLVPDTITYWDVSGNKRELIHEFIAEEYLRFPFATHDDMLDAVSMSQHEASELMAPVVLRPKMDAKLPGPLDTDDYDGISFMGV